MNIASILKDCPKGTKLYCPIFGEVTFDEITSDNKMYPITIRTSNNAVESFTANGRFVSYENGECMLFPSKDNRDWSTFKMSRQKFNVGDIVIDDNKEIRKIVDVRTKEYVYICNDQCFHCPIDAIDGYFHLWTINDAKPGDAIFGRYNNNLEYLFIFKNIEGKNINTSCCYTIDLDEFTASYTMQNVIDNDKFDCRLASEDQKSILFDIMNNLRYSIKENTMEKEYHFNPFDKVLVRDSGDEIWTARFFSHIDKVKEPSYPYVTVAGAFKQCIPYEGNEHLLGTKNHPNNDNMNNTTKQ